MANVYAPTSLGISQPKTGFQQGGWYNGRQYWNGTLSDPGVIHPESNQVGAGQTVSAEVNLQSDAAQGNKAGDIEKYLATQRSKFGNVQPTANIASNSNMGSSMTSGGGSGVDVASLLAGASGGSNSLDLPTVYNNLYKESGVSELESQLSKMKDEFVNAKGITDNNPFLSEASRVGRQAKLQTQFDDRTANTISQIAMRKADIETQLNLQTKQFDINNAQSKAALDKLNSLISMGALTEANGQDIAALTKATGIPSSMILSAVKTSQSANVPTKLIESTDDAGNVVVSVINTQTGEILSQNSLGTVGKATKSSGGGDAEIGSTKYKTQELTAVNQFLEQSKNSYGHVSPTDWNSVLQAYIAAGLGSSADFYKSYANYADPNRGDFRQAYGFDLEY